MLSCGNVVVSSDGKVEKRDSAPQNPFKYKPSSFSVPFYSYQRKSKFRNSEKASQYIKGVINASLQQNEAIKRGVLLHYLFSNVVTIDDIPNAADRLLYEGMISSLQEKDELVTYATQKINEHIEWFTPGLKTYNECSILSRDEKGHLKICRPDRVIQCDNKMIIIDFKTGKKLRKHQKQIDEYASLLQKMGYETETYLWYLS